MSSSLRLERQQKDMEFAYCPFFLGLKRRIRSHTTVVPSKTILVSRPKWAKYIPFFRPNRRTNHTVLGAAVYGLDKRVLSPGRYLTWFRSLLYIGPYKKAVKEAHDPLDFSSTCVQAQLYEFHEFARRLASYM